MTKSTTIARPEIAELLGIGVTKLVNIIRYTDAKVPEPIGKEVHQLIYDREAVLAWIATRPLENLTWRQPVKKTPTPEHLARLDRAMLIGTIGISRAQHTQIQRKRVVAKHVPGKTQRDEVRGGAYDGGDDGRSNRRSRQAG